MALNNLKGLSELAKAAKGKKGKEVLTVPVDDVVSKVQFVSASVTLKSWRQPC